jgi:Cd(II)/Pb(II)-responsive transcriptional regulator
MKIGELALLSGCSIQTIRFYEREKLLPKPQRSEGNFRLYDTEAQEKLLFIKRCRSLNLSLEEIRGLLDYKTSPTDCCDEINQLVDEHLNTVKSNIKELQLLKYQLEDLRRTCAKETTIEDCGILQKLSQN